jgi:hypothetical protein
VTPGTRSAARSGSPICIRRSIRSPPWRSQPLPVLLRRALHRRLPHPHRRAALHQEDLQRQPARLGAHHSRRQRSGPELLARLPGGRAVRRQPACCTATTRSPSRSAACSVSPWTVSTMRTGAASGVNRALRASQSGLRGRRAGIAGLRGGTGAGAVSCRGRFRQPPAARRPEHLRRGGVQAARRPTACARWNWYARWAWNSARPKWGPRSLDRSKREFALVFLGYGPGRHGRLGIPGEAIARRHRRSALHRALQDQRRFPVGGAWS